MVELKLSVIIPTINEANCLPVLLQQLRQQKNIELDIIIADGGSTDATIAVAQSKGATVVHSDKGRAKQLNSGAKAARFNFLFFLHADSFIEDQHLLSAALKTFEAQYTNNKNLAGHFPLKFIRDTNKHQLSFRFLEAKSATNREFTINGDQGLLISKHYFQNLGGYNESLSVMEDQDIAARIFAGGQWLLLPGVLATSARRFEAEGFHRRYILMSLMMGLYWTGAHSFFGRAKNVYAEQGETNKLKLWPFFICIARMLKEDFGFKQSIVQWYKVGRYVRENAWQAFFFMDVALGKAQRPCTHFYQRFVLRLVSNSICNTLVGIGVFCWYTLVLAPCFFVLDNLFHTSPEK